MTFYKNSLNKFDLSKNGCQGAWPVSLKYLYMKLIFSEIKGQNLGNKIYSGNEVIFYIKSFKVIIRIFWKFILIKNKFLSNY